MTFDRARDSTLEPPSFVIPIRHLLLLLLAVLATLAPVLALAAPRQPNVVLIYTDDQGSVDAHCYGADDLITPHIDSLAQDGIRFTQFYSAAPVCSPSRAASPPRSRPSRAHASCGATRSAPTRQASRT